MDRWPCCAAGPASTATRAALDSAGVEVDPALIRNGNFHHVGGYQAARELFELPEPPTAIFAGSDEQAFGVAEAARVTGRRIPEDLSVVGFDDLSISRWFSPPLTTVRQPLGRDGSDRGGDAVGDDRRARAARPPGRAGHRARGPFLDGPAARRAERCCRGDDIGREHMPGAEGVASARRRWLEVTGSAELRAAVDRVIPADEWPGAGRVVSEISGRMRHRAAVGAGCPGTARR